MAMDKFWSAKELEAMPTIHVGHFDDLKLDTGWMRVWLSRCGLEDGAPYRKGVTIEILRDGRWETAREYEGATVHDPC